MKKLRWRFFILLYTVIMVATFLAIFFSGILRLFLYPGTDSGDTLLFGFAFKEMLFPFSLFLFTAFAIAIYSKIFVRPIVDISDATKEIASGNFDVRLTETGRLDEVGELQRNFNRMAKELQSNEYLKKDFISNVSHEFKTPLSVIRGYAKLLSEDDIEGVQRKEYATLILKESERLSDLASNILRLSKIDNQELVVKRSKFLLDEQIRQAVLLLEPKWKKKDVRFDIGLDKTFYEGDEELLSQVWVNLLDNAIKFIHENGKIDIEMLHMPGAVCVKISDNGIGMDAYTRERIFEHFFQGDFSHSKEGNGLGLSIVRRIVELHGGKIEVQSEPGKGSVFEVWLPAQKEDSSKVKRPAGARQ